MILQNPKDNMASLKDLFIEIAYEISRKSQESLKLMTSHQPANQKPNFDNCARKFPKICKTFKT